MGYGLEYSCLPVAGSFYFTPAVLRGKVYTVQNDKLPFAAIHGDPDVLVPGKTRFGPTALPLPMLERYHPRTILDFFQVLRPDPAIVQVLWDLIKTSDIRNYILKNIAFEVPLLNRRLFLQDARKIVPSLRLEDLTFATNIGGIRPQLIDKQKKQLILGQAKIETGSGILFNVTPSPGATNCLGTAEADAQTIAHYLECHFNHAAFQGELISASPC
jgi:malate dehydrogenase (quinone)